MPPVVAKETRFPSPLIKKAEDAPMSDARTQTRFLMKSLLGAFGCYDAVAETFNARWGGGASKGTVSKKASGALDWTVADVVALEDAAGRFPVTRMLVRRLDQQPAEVGGSLLEDSSSIAKESGEAISAILSAQQSSSADERAQALTEIDEAIAALRIARRRLGGGSGGATVAGSRVTVRLGDGPETENVSQTPATRGRRRGGRI